MSYPGQSAAEVGEPRRPRRTLAVSLGAVAALTLLGAPLGLLWAAVAPGVPLVQTDEGAVLTEAQPEGFIAADGWFSLLGLCFGVLASIGVWSVLRRHRGPLGLVVAVVGSLAAAVVAWRVGRLIGLAEYETLRDSAPVGQTFDRPADLRAGGVDWFFGVVPVLRGDVLLAAFAAAVTYTLLAGWSRWPSLRPEPEPTMIDPALLGYGPGAALPGPDSGPAAVAPGPAPVSWGSVSPPAPSTAPEPPAPGAAEPPRG